jgi:hypothetical protein
MIEEDHVCSEEWNVPPVPLQYGMGTLRFNQYPCVHVIFKSTEKLISQGSCSSLHVVVNIAYYNRIARVEDTTKIVNPSRLA